MMASPQKPPETAPLQPVVKTWQQQQQQQTEAQENIMRTLRIGAGAGACGLLFGATSGIIRGAPPVLFSLTTGAIWAVSASVFWQSRWLALPKNSPGLQVKPSEKVMASAFGGAVSGAVNAAIFRGPGNVIPAIAVVSTYGAVGQYLLNKWDARAVSASKGEKKEGWSVASFLPLKKMTDQEYEEMLEEKILRLEANIALVDESIAALEAQRTATTKSAGLSPTSTSASS